VPSFRDEAAAATRVRDGLLERLSDLDAAVKPSAWFVLARPGDSKSAAAVVKAAKTDCLSELADVVLALSYSPNREADKVLLDIADRIPNFDPLEVDF
jgi:hypothetical protein